MPIRIPADGAATGILGMGKAVLVSAVMAGLTHEVEWVGGVYKEIGLGENAGRYERCPQQFCSLCLETGEVDFAGKAPEEFPARGLVDYTVRRVAGGAAKVAASHFGASPL